MRYLITGHTGFKGSWLSLMLHIQGHAVSGFSLDPLGISLFKDADLPGIFKHDLRGDIRDREKLANAIKEIDPEVVIHLAAQPLVRESYRNPLGTYETNVIGTLNLLDATKYASSLKATLVVTTDKVYRNRNHFRGYIESDELGGDDPYSSSKAAADIATQSWVKSFNSKPVTIARAGNVIGGGDWATDRIIPDLVKAYSLHELPKLRYPQAIRPWQHVLDCLNGYLALTDKMLTDGFTGEWNFGPSISEKHDVLDLVQTFAKAWGVLDWENAWIKEVSEQPHEAGYLLLDSSKARSMLNWKDKLSFSESVKFTVDWYQKHLKSNPREVTINQIERYLAI